MTAALPAAAPRDARAGGRRLARGLETGDVLVLTLSALSPAASLFITGSALLHLAGSGAVAALLIGGLAINIASLLYAELGAAFPSAGGVYPGIAGVLGPRSALAAIALGLVTMPAILAFHAIGLADYLRVTWPALPQRPLALAMLVTAALIAACPIRASLRAAALFLAAELGAVLTVALAGGLRPARTIGATLAHPQLLDSHAALVPTPGWTVLLGAIAGAFACSGSSLAISFAEDLRGRPRRVGWIVMASGVIATAVIAGPLILVVRSTPDLRAMLAAEAPIAFHLAATIGPAAARIAAVAVAIAIFNNLVANLLAYSRFLFATGRDGIWPGEVGDALARLHRRFGSPVVAVAALAVVAAGLSLLGPHALLILVSGDLVTPLLVVLAVLVGRRRGLTGRTGFRAPLHPLVPIAGLGILAAFAAAEWADPIAGRRSLLVLMAVAAGAFACAGRSRRA